VSAEVKNVAVAHAGPVISFYSSTVFVDGGFTETQALYASLGFGALNL
jgi:hypothetical protein